MQFVHEVTSEKRCSNNEQQFKAEPQSRGNEAVFCRVARSKTAPAAARGRNYDKWVSGLQGTVRRIELPRRDAGIHSQSRECGSLASDSDAVVNAQSVHSVARVTRRDRELGSGFSAISRNRRFTMTEPFDAAVFN